MNPEFTKLLADLNIAIEKATKAREYCVSQIELLTGEKKQSYEETLPKIQNRLQRLSICADIISGHAYVVVQKDKELYVQEGSDPKLGSLAEKLGLKAEFIQGKADLP